MASKALSKEIRGLVSQKTTAVRKRMAEASTTERLLTTGVAPLGAGLAGVLDAYDVRIPLGSKLSMPVSPIGAALGIGAGLLMGKGAAGASLLGFGIGQLDGFFYGLGRSLVESMGGADDDADDEA
jgi:hypothetical protein